MTEATTQVNYSVHTLGSSDIQSTVELFIKCFCDDEKITKHLGIHHQDYLPFAQEVVQKAAKEGLSKVAVDKKNRVIAFAIAEDLYDPFIPHVAHYPKMNPILALMKQLSKPFLEDKKYIKGKVVHVWVAGVDSNYRGLHLSTMIDMACIESAAHKGFDFAYAEFVNELSENVTHQFHVLKLVNEVYFNDFSMDDHSRPFEGVRGAATSYVATIRPGISLDSLKNCYMIQGRQ